MGKDRRQRKPRPKKRVSRFEMLAELRGGATDRWATSDNPIKRRIGRLEVAWREGIQWMAEDIQKMFANFATIADAYDVLDINTMALKSLLVEKGLITEDEFQEKRTELIEMVNKIREQKRKELEEAQRKAEEEAAAEQSEEDRRIAEAEKKALDGSKVDPELSRMRKAAEDAGKNASIPDEAFRF